MTKLTQNERLAVLEEKVEAMNKKLDLFFQESKEFHSELILKLEKLDGEKVQIATLKEKVKTLEKITWLALTAAVGSMIKALFDLITKQP